jgi:hypothetical protein
MQSWYRRQVNKTASYTIDPNRDQQGTLFTNYGASGGVTFTLPTPGRSLWLRQYYFVSLTDDDVTVATPVADTGITFNELDADSVAASTSSQKIGSHLVATCLQTAANTYAWVLAQFANGVTLTVND